MTGWLLARPRRLLMLGALVNLAVPAIVTLSLGWRWTSVVNLLVAAASFAGWVRFRRWDRELADQDRRAALRDAANRGDLGR